MGPYFFWAILLWLILGLRYLLRWRVFRAQPLHDAPLRPNHLAAGWHIVVAGVLFVLLPGLFISVLMGPITLSCADEDTRQTRELILYMLGIAVCGLAMLGLCKIAFVQGLGRKGLGQYEPIRGAMWGLLAMGVSYPVLLVVMQGVTLISQQLRSGAPLPKHKMLQILENSPSTGLVGVIILLAGVVAPLVEELFFRGILQSALVGLWPKKNHPPAWWRWMAIAVVGILFALMHWNGEQANYEVFLPLFLLSLVAGYVYERTGNLWSAITVHMVFNVISLLATLAGMGGAT